MSHILKISVENNSTSNFKIFFYFLIINLGWFQALDSGEILMEPKYMNRNVSGAHSLEKLFKSHQRNLLL